MTITLAGNTTLVKWDDTSTNDAIAMLLIPESALGEGTQATGIDPKATQTDTISANTTGTNPFNRSLQVFVNTNAQKTNPFIITFPGTFPLDGTYQNFVLLIRYKGDPTPLTSITCAISS